jgi:outer membrane protein
MTRLKAPLSLVCAWMLAASSLPAQNAIHIEPPKGTLGWFTRPYQAPTVPDIDMANSDRLERLIRAGNLYVSATDVVALALENNLDIEIQRYGPILNQQVTKRALSGALLRTGLGVGVAQGPQSVSLTGVSVSASGGNVAGSTATAAGVLTQLGPSPPSLDPTITLVGQWGHQTSPESNTILTGTTALIYDYRFYEAQVAQTFQFGLNYALTYSSTHNKFNSSFYAINPYDSGALDLTINQPLLNGFGRAVNGRDVYIAKNNEKVGDLQFKQQVITTITAVLNLYWDLVTFYQDLKAKRDELATAQSLFEDNKKQVNIGTLAPIEVTRAEAQVYASQQDLLVSQTNLLQQETVLKNAISKNGVASAILADVHVIPLDTIQVPEKDEFAPIDQLVAEALGKRTEVLTQRVNIESDKRGLVGIKNGLRPNLTLTAELTNNALAGPEGGAFQASAAALVGGYNTLLGQIFGRDYPSYSAGISLNLPLRNRAAQSDYATSVLQLRQTELQLQKQINQVRVDVQNAVIGLQQARARYDSSVKARILQQQTLDADKKKYTLGASTVFQVITDQQSLSTAQTSEVEALANYSHARIAFDQAVGTTLETNHVSLDEALAGRVARQSVLPAELPTVEQRQ